METEQPRKLKDSCICIFIVDCWSCGATERVLVPISSFDVEAPLSTRTCGSVESPEVKSLNMLDMLSFFWKEALGQWDHFFPSTIHLKSQDDLELPINYFVGTTNQLGSFLDQVNSTLDVTVRNIKFGITAFQNFLVQKFVFVNTWILFHW